MALQPGKGSVEALQVVLQIPSKGLHLANQARTASTFASHVECHASPWHPLATAPSAGP